MIALDTHVWFWLINSPERLSDATAAAIGETGSYIVPAVCCWELGMLAEKGRLRFPDGIRAWIRRALLDPGAIAVPLTPAIATDAALLNGSAIGGDPADRMIYATARAERATLVTRDERLRGFDPDNTLW